MILQEIIINDMRLTSDIKRKNVLRLLVDSLQKNGKEVLTDAQTLSIIQETINAEKKLLLNTRNVIDNLEHTNTIDILSEYTVKKYVASFNEIKEWAINNVDCSSHINKMHAIRKIAWHFGDNADVTLIKDVVLSMSF